MSKVRILSPRPEIIIDVCSAHVYFFISQGSAGVRAMFFDVCKRMCFCGCKNA